MFSVDLRRVFPRIPAASLKGSPPHICELSATDFWAALQIETPVCLQPVFSVACATDFQALPIRISKKAGEKLNTSRKRHYPGLRKRS